MSEFVVLGISLLCGMWPVIFPKQRNQVLPEVLRISIQPKTTFHKTGRRGLDCCLALDVLAQNSKLAEYLEKSTV